MNQISAAVAVTLAAAASLATAGKITIICPTELPAEAMKISSAPPGWKPFVSSPIFLHSAAPIAGPPERLGQMVGQTTRKSKTEWTIEYLALDAPYPEGVWFSCDYGEGNEFSLARKLPADVKSCVVKYKKGEKAGQHTLDINCK